MVKGAEQLLVKDHLRELRLNAVQRQLDQLRDMLDLHPRERLDDAQQILLEKRLVEIRHVVLNDRIIEMSLVNTENAFEFRERSLLQRLRDSEDCGKLRALVLQSR